MSTRYIFKAYVQHTTVADYHRNGLYEFEVVQTDDTAYYVNCAFGCSRTYNTNKPTTAIANMLHEHAMRVVDEPVLIDYH